jgi:hypothetical protein
MELTEPPGLLIDWIDSHRDRLPASLRRLDRH